MRKSTSATKIKKSSAAGLRNCLARTRTFQQTSKSRPPLRSNRAKQGGDGFNLQDVAKYEKFAAQVNVNDKSTYRPASVSG